MTRPLFALAVFTIGVLACLAVLPHAQARAQDALPRVSDHISVVSEPSGAEVWTRDSLLGTTPLALPVAFADTLRVWYPSRDAWRAQRALLAPPFIPAREGVVMARFPRAIDLLASAPDAIPPRGMLERDAPLSIPRLAITGPAVIGLGAGIAAVVLKQKADRVYDSYLLSADPDLLSRTRRYDLAAGVALAVLEASVGYFVYLLFMQD